MNQLTDRIDDAIRSGASFESLNIPEGKMRAAREYISIRLPQIESEVGATPATEAFTLSFKQSDPEAYEKSVRGAKIRGDVREAEEAVLDALHYQNQLRTPSGADAPVKKDTGYNWGKITAEYEDPQDVVTKMNEVLKGEGRATYITNRQGEPIFGYQKKGENTFYQVTPDSLLEDPASVLGNIAAHPWEAIGALAGGLYQKGGVMAKAAVEGMAAATGRAVDEILEAFDFSDDKSRVAENVKDIATSGALGAAGSVIGDVIIGAKGLSDNPQVADYLADIEAAAKRRGVELKTSAADRPDASPILTRADAIWDTLTGAKTKREFDVRRNAFESLADQLRVTSESAGLPLRHDGTHIDWEQARVLGLSDDDLIKQKQIQEDALVAATEDALRKTSSFRGEDATDLAKHVEDFETILTNYDSTSKAVVDGLYDEVYRLSDQIAETAFETGAKPLQFKFPGWKEALSDKTTIEVFGDNGELVSIDLSTLDKPLQTVVEKMRTMAENQSVATRRVPTEIDVPVTDARTGQAIGTEKAVDQMEQARYRPASETLASIKELRSVLGAMSQTDPATGMVTASGRVAKRLYALLSDGLKNPEGGTKELRSLWNLANEGHAARISNLQLFEAGKIVNAAKAGQGSKYVGDAFNKIADKSNEYVGKEFVEGLARELRPDQFRQLQVDYTSSLLRNPGAMKDRVWSKAEMDMVPSDARKLLRTYGERWTKLKRGDRLDKAVGEYLTSGERLRNVVLSAKAEELPQLVRQAGISRDAVQATIMADLLSKSTATRGGREVVEPKKFLQHLRSLKSGEQSGRWDMLTGAQKEALDDYDKLLSFVTHADNIAVSLTGMTIIEKMTNPLRPARFASGAASYSKYYLIAKMMQSPTGKKLLQDKAQLKVMDRSSSKMVRTSAIMGTLLLNDIMSSAHSGGAPSAAQKRAER